MKLLIASDLHGSAYNCRLLLEAFQREKADRLVLLGDLLYHGPRNPFPQEYDTKAVTAMLNGAADRLLCVRGNCDSEVDYGPDTPPPLQLGDFLLCGHIHLPVRREMGHFTYLNPGSLALPKEETPRSYMTLENGVFSWHELETGAEFQPLP